MLWMTKESTKINRRDFFCYSFNTSFINMTGNTEQLMLTAIIGPKLFGLANYPPADSTPQNIVMILHFFHKLGLQAFCTQKW